MMVLRCSSDAAGINELVELGEGSGEFLFLAPKAVRTGKELEAAFAMARSAFDEGRNLSPKLQNEAMLFLAQETNFSAGGVDAGRGAENLHHRRRRGGFQHLSGALFARGERDLDDFVISHAGNVGNKDQRSGDLGDCLVFF